MFNRKSKRITELEEKAWLNYSTKFKILNEISNLKLELVFMKSLMCNKCDYNNNIEEKINKINEYSTNIINELSK